MIEQIKNIIADIENGNAQLAIAKSVLLYKESKDSDSEVIQMFRLMFALVWNAANRPQGFTANKDCSNAPL